VAHDILPEELDNSLPCNVGEQHYFHPLSEVVRGYQQESKLRQRTGNRIYHIKPPMHEEPGTPQSVELRARSV